MEKKINKWKEAGKVSKIVKVLKDGNFKNRVFALRALSEIKDPDTIDHIKPLIYDPVKPVIQSAIEALQQLNVSLELQIEIKERLQFLQNEEKVRAAKRTENEKAREKQEQDYLEDKLKEMKLREVDREAREVNRKNEKQKIFTDTLGKIIGGPT